MADIDSPEFRARFMQHQLLTHNAVVSADQSASVMAEKSLPTNTGLDGSHHAADISNDDESSSTSQTEPVPRPRTVVLSCLPPGTTLTLVQALIHDGNVEELALNESRSTAHVTFTSASDFEKYCDAHAEGFIAFQFMDWQYAVLVHKHTGVTEGTDQVEIGTTRVLKATDVKGFWSIEVLKALSEGKDNARKVEAIIMTYAYDVCTVDFRFAKISDAVAFRAQLAEDANWKSVQVQFGIDPCGAATGIHLDG